MSAAAALWLTIGAIGLYHGLNPAMGWPLAVANGMSEHRARAVFATLLPLGGGHLAAMAVALLPFAWLTFYVEWSRAIRLGAGALVLLFGLFLLVQRRHPRALARIRPSRLAWWSFLTATAHGAGLMLVPFMLKLCEAQPGQGDAHATMMATLARSSLATAVAVAVVHTLAMMLAGLAMAWAVYRYLGLKFLRSAWLNLDRVWAVSLIAAGIAGLVTTL
ncbi:MAG: Conserved transrane protein [Ramlibacter sp.]|nr:Conserved transrane protein [Ramlibacter sp.]